MSRPSFRFPGGLSSLLTTNPKKGNPSEDAKHIYLDHTSSQFMPVDRVKELSALPRLVDLNEWLATNTIGFFNHINQCYGVLSEFCAQSCPTMSAGSTQYTWQEEKGKKVKLSAPKHIDLVMSLIEHLLTDEQTFPTKFGNITGISENQIKVDGSDFPSTFQTQIKKIFKYLCQVLAHILHGHYQEIVDVNLRDHFNTLTAHFFVFATTFQLLEQKDLQPVEDFIAALHDPEVLRA
ncbi:MOB kinase activator 2-like isoform X2 [Sycon ciliatum]|uniref:MOB kinase activator 2-like isoform X2 n=1 Tax=Sycon ciliatum TaxID=27933 RepID=UPI0031F63158